MTAMNGTPSAGLVDSRIKSQCLSVSIFARLRSPNDRLNDAFNGGSDG